MEDFHRQNPTKPIIISEYGAGVERGRHRESPKRYGFLRRAQLQVPRILLEDDRSEKPYIAGSLVWNVFDFAVENRIKGQTIPHMNQKGIFTYDRRPKDVYYFYRSQLDRRAHGLYRLAHVDEIARRVLRRFEFTAIARRSNFCLMRQESWERRSKAQGFLWDVPLGTGNNDTASRSNTRR